MLGSLVSEVGPLSGLLRLTLLEAQLPFWFVDKYLRDDSTIIFLDLAYRGHCLKMDARGSTSTGGFEGGYRPLTYSRLLIPLFTFVASLLICEDNGMCGPTVIF